MTDIIGTKENPWKLNTSSMSSKYTMHKDIKLVKEKLVCTVGSTFLLYGRDKTRMEAILPDNHENISEKWPETDITNSGTCINYNQLISFYQLYKRSGRVVKYMTILFSG